MTTDALVFALACDESTLFVFASEAGAIAHCEAVDVEDGQWRFWRDDGTALRADFIEAPHRGTFACGGGRYRLIADSTQAGLTASWGDVRQMESNPFFASLSAIAGSLATHRATARS